MSTNEYLHVCEFFETVFCFSLLFLVGQKFYIIFRKYDDKYAQYKNTQYELQIKWINQRSNTQPKQQIDQEKTIKQQRKVIQQASMKLEKEKFQENSIKDNNLKEALVSDQHQTTDRRFQDKNTEQPIQIGQRVDKRKSLTSLSNAGQMNSGQIQIKDEQSVIDHEQKQQSSINRQDQQISNFNSFNHQSRQNPYEQSIRPSEYGAKSQISSHQARQRKYIGYFIKIDNVFNEYIPIVISTIVLGMLTDSTLIFSMVCFFAYIFATLLLNYADLLASTKNKTQQVTIFSKIQRFVSGIFIIALFIDYWADSQYQF